MISWSWLIVAFLAGVSAVPVLLFSAGHDEGPRERTTRLYRLMGAPMQKPGGR
jgi:hypothetical protein